MKTWLGGRSLARRGSRINVKYVDHNMVWESQLSSRAATWLGGCSLARGWQLASRVEAWLGVAAWLRRSSWPNTLTRSAVSAV